MRMVFKLQDRSNWKQMSELKEDKKTFRGESEFHYSKNIICCKWCNNKPPLLLATNIDGMSGLSNRMRKTKGSATKTPVSCLNIIRLYNNGMGYQALQQWNGWCRYNGSKQLLTDSIVKASIFFTWKYF